MVTSGGSVHLGPLSLGLGNQVIAVLDLLLLGAVVLQGGQGVVVNIAVDETGSQGRPASDLFHIITCKEE